MNVIFGQSSIMAVAREKLERIADTSVPGSYFKEKTAPAKTFLPNCWHARSNRAKAAWVKVTCPAIPHSLIESELFGYEKGAFTGAYVTKRGRSGTRSPGERCFWDEVGSLDMSAQAKLLQKLPSRWKFYARRCSVESRRVDTRPVCAANGNTPAADRRWNLSAGFLLPNQRRHNWRCRLCGNGAVDLPILVDYFL